MDLFRRLVKTINELTSIKATRAIGLEALTVASVERTEQLMPNPFDALVKAALKNAAEAVLDNESMKKDIFWRNSVCPCSLSFADDLTNEDLKAVIQNRLFLLDDADRQDSLTTPIAEKALEVFTTEFVKASDEGIDDPTQKHIYVCTADKDAEEISQEDVL